MENQNRKYNALNAEESNNIINTLLLIELYTGTNYKVGITK
jgi:hypothetical protein